MQVKTRPDRLKQLLRTMQKVKEILKDQQGLSNLPGRDCSRPLPNRPIRWNPCQKLQAESDGAVKRFPIQIVLQGWKLTFSIQSITSTSGKQEKEEKDRNYK